MNKKLIKTLAIGGVAVMGAGLLTGCSAELTKPQVDKLIASAEKVDAYVDSQSEVKVDLDVVYSMYKNATMKLVLNEDNVWDNMTMHQVGSDKCKDEEYSFTSDSAIYKGENNKFLYTKTIDGEDCEELLYTTVVANKEESYWCKSFIETETDYKLKEKEEKPYYSILQSNFSFMFLGDLASPVTKDDITSVSIENNGDYVITAVVESTAEDNAEIRGVCKYTCTISADGMLKAMSTNFVNTVSYSKQVSPTESVTVYEGEHIEYASMTFGYNNVSEETKDVINGMYNQFKLLPVTPNE